MTSVLDLRRTAALRRAAVRATFAPSVHNTQPWRFVLRDGELGVYADRSRRLEVLDPTSRQLTISCGSALMNARVSLASSGFGAKVDRLPDSAHSDLLARITTTDQPDTSAGFAALDSVLELRQTNRRRFDDEQVPAEVLAALEKTAAAEHSTLFVVSREEHRVAVARLTRTADVLENADPAYRAEIRAWTTDDLGRRDGVRELAVPYLDGLIQDEVPLRVFDIGGMGSPPPGPHSTRSQCLVVLGTEGDRPIDWLRAGEALERTLLEITKRGFAAGPLTQAVEVPSTRIQLRAELGLTMYPQMLLRIGRAPLSPAARRRRLVDVLVEDA
jgi:hypothetical protein